MRIMQLVGSLHYGDAVGNDVLALDKLLRINGADTMIYAESIDRRISHEVVRYYTQMSTPEKDDILIYHLAFGSVVMRNFLLKQDCRKVLVYHNITPKEYFVEYDKNLVQGVQVGFDDLRCLSGEIEYCITDSEFNKSDLRRLGYKVPIAVVPILVPFEDYDKPADKNVLAQYQNDGWTNILFVGRIVPNKKQEDIIQSFAYYKMHYNKKARLFLVGNYQGMELYYKRLQEYVKALKIDDVIFTGHTRFDEILAYYKLADIFLCMSEHEGFCVPLLEAMKFKVPIIAYAAAAVPETLGDAGILIEKKDYRVIAAVIDYLVKHKDFSNMLINQGTKWLESFSYVNVAQKAEKVFEAIMNAKDFNKIEVDSAAMHIKTTGNPKQQFLKQIERQVLENDMKSDLCSFEDIRLHVSVKESIKLVLKGVFQSGYAVVNTISPTLASIIKRSLRRFF